MDTNAAAGKKHVLVVDDNVELALMYKEMLEGQGFQVSTAPNGVIALKQILNRKIDAIICDLRMPQLEGDMFYITVQRVAPHLCDRFLFITGQAETERFAPFVDKTPAPVLRKPVSGEQLTRELNAIFKRHPD
jgi:CheY-like chemotaxis protein